MKRIINITFLLILLILATTSIVIARSVTSPDIIYIDPGHGGEDGGAVGSGGICEKNIVLNISLLLKKYFENSGYKVMLTRNGDYDLASLGSKNRKREDIHKRVKLINESKCILYISVHANSYPGQSVKGAQVFFNSKNKESVILANEIQENLKAGLMNTHRIAKSIGGKYLIDNTDKVGCLVEVGFLSNNEELSLLQDQNYQSRLAYFIYVGTLEYLQDNQ